jgi:hypothetical protein
LDSTTDPIFQKKESLVDLEGGEDVEELPEDAGMGEVTEAASEEVPLDPMAKIAAFLSQMPPNWELAEKHGRANLCIHSSETVVNFDDPSSYCQCC